MRALATAAAVGVLFFYRLTGAGLVGPDEPRYAWIGREMAVSGDWVTPRLWGEPWFEKPALLYWMIAAGFRAGLSDDLAPRLPVALLSVAFLAFFYRRLESEFGKAPAAYAAVLLATSAGWTAYSHAAVFDLPLAATFGAAMLVLLGWVERGGRGAAAAFGALLGAAMLAKGLAGPVLAVLTLVVWARWGGWKRLRDLARPAPLGAFLAVAAPWYVACFVRNGRPFLAEFFWRHHVERFAAGALEHHQPIWFFVPVLAAGLLPWTPLYVAAVRAPVWRDRRVILLAAWAAVTLVFFSLSRDKLPGYVLPALPALAALGGLAVARSERRLRAGLALSALALALIPAAESVLPAALSTGLGEALEHAGTPAAALALAAALAAGVWLAETRSRRALAVAMIAAGAVAGYARIKHSAFPEIDRQAGARALWREAQAHADELCLGGLRRHLAYGLHYYAHRRLPACADEPRPYRVENGRLVLSWNP